MVLSLTSDAEGSARKLAKGQSSVTSDAILAAVLKSLDDDKAEDVVQIDLRGISEIGDHMVICSGRSTRQVAAISEKLKSRLKDDLGILSKVEGKGTGDWVLVDTGDVIVHVFRPEVREFYQLALFNEKRRSMEPQGKPQITENRQNQVAKKLDISTSYVYR